MTPEQRQRARDELSALVSPHITGSKHVRARVAAIRALLDALDAAEARAEQLDGSAGWLYVSDDGVEWSADHPVWSGQVPDALDIRPATRSALLIELRAAWEVRAEVAASSAAAESRATAAEALLREAGEVVGEARNYLPTIPIAAERDVFRAKIDALAAKLKARAALTTEGR